VHFCLQPYTLFLLVVTLHIIYFLHLLSTNHKYTQPYYFPLLLKRRRWTGILRWGVLGYASPRFSFLWRYGVFHCSVSPRVTLVFKDINYVIIILYIYDIWLSVSTFGRMCGTIDPGSCIRWVLGFGIKLGMIAWRQWCPNAVHHPGGRLRAARRSSWRWVWEPCIFLHWFY
jgi:hypothetical protein